jgi:hypothetical protein
VYLDGDDPGAQRWGERFRVVGYPTLVILRSDRKEVTRLSGGMDLSLYADVLDVALHDVKPITEVLRTLRGDPGSLTAGDCQRLAYTAWGAEEYSDPERKSLAAQLARAAKSCTRNPPIEQARLVVESAALEPTPPMVTRVFTVLGDASIAPHVADTLEELGDPFFDAVKRRAAPERSAFASNWQRTMDRVANDPALIDADRLAAIAAELDVVKRLAPDGKIPANLAADARARAAAALAKKVDPYVRAGVVNSAAAIDEELGESDAEYALLESELGTARSPYYYMADLGVIEEKRGHAPAALAWDERAYRESRGIATRFQWGARYLSALLRLAPKDDARIRAVGAAVIAELDGPDRIQARSRLGLERLDGRLRKWNAKYHDAAAIKVLREQMRAVCAKLPSNDSGLASCRKFLSGVA